MPKRSWFFVGMGAVALGAVLFGFGRTYVVPMSRGTFAAPWVVHLHGALAMTWVLLFLTQPLLVRYGALSTHRRIGRLGVPLAIGVAVTMLPAGVFQATRDAAAGAGSTGISAMLGVLTSGLLFVALVVAGIMSRRDREAHARWLLLATLVVIWPAWFRFRHWFPAVPRPDIWFGVVLSYTWIVVAMLRDWRARGSVHPVLLYGGGAVIAEQVFEVLSFDSAWWREAAQLLYGALHG
ncbi:hypothetical protein [Gemmatimonas groenlandica]|uniref:DUF2306 domain-containing protein n=1 Tax=Gemmatimonas groenlandica TaxID=2732249 RepID=A0A6M4IMI6_9BACT|nr:hypothetical protein [Gemmatimonas groenlandica]QJR34626.1 hypothetical protein HKW67_03385 [Gemmatimonas groenlandica]